MILAAFRASVVEILNAGLAAGTPIWDTIPDNANELPCVVVGRPTLRRTAVAVVADLTLDVWTIGRRQEAGGSEVELLTFTDYVFDALGGTRGVKSLSGELIGVNRVDPRLVPIAGMEHPAFTTTVEASAATC